VFTATVNLDKLADQLDILLLKLRKRFHVCDNLPNSITRT
jgi:hypothetical protein